MKITKDMSIQSVISKYPHSIAIFFKHGLGCIGCAAASFETIEQGANVHGIDIDVLIADLNQGLEED